MRFFRLAPAITLSLVASICGAADRKRSSTPADHNWDIAIMDRALASAKPTDPWVKFGDVGIKYADLKVYRDRLAGKVGPSANQAVNPEAVTPAGTTFKWPNGIVPYRFDPAQVGNNTITAPKMQQFRDGIAEWTAFANLTFTEFTGSPPTNYITVQEDPSLGGGFSSSVGMGGGEQFVKIGPNAWNRGTVCHEVGHALGLWHEQQRPDRDTYVTINSSNIISGTEGNFALIMNGGTFSTPYDFFSVMHYTRNTFAINPNQDTIIMKPGYTQFADIIGNVYDRTLSKVERAGMAAIYGPPAVLPSAVVTNTKDGGPGSLRTAIYFAFDNSPSSSPTPSPAIPTTITFHIPTSDPGYNSGTGIFTIKPTFLLDALGDGTTIDGTSQTAFTGNTNTAGPEIALDGSNFTALQAAFSLYAPGLTLRGSNCTIKGLTIVNFNQWGIWIQDGATGNLIGGTTPSARNVISGNAFQGIGIEGATTTNNVVQGNYIGTDQTGATAQPGGNAGVAIYLGAHGNTIGGTTAAARNIISGNLNQGVVLADAGTNNNLIQGNYIGTDPSGAIAVPNGNGFSGIDIFGGAQSNTIGGTAAGARNVISGNSGSGIAIYEFNDITAIGTRNNLIQGNLIGLKADGSAALANQSDGISIFGGAPSNVIGGTAAGAGNVISGNSFAGITLSGLGTNNTNIQGNIIGLNPAGTAQIHNGTDGIALFGSAQSNTIGGTTAAARNVISGNAYSGISIGGNQTNNNLVQGNYIGVDVSGAVAQANGSDGIAIYGDGPPPSPTPAPPPNTGAQSNTIGGTVAGARNIISGNAGSGISIGNPGTNGTNNNVVQGNYIGVDATGSARANGFNGVVLYGGAQTNKIGGTAAGAGNVISSNNATGLAIGGAGCNGNLVQGNYIGINAAGAARANGAEGIAIYGGAQSNVIGGTVAGLRNFISANLFSGITISGIGTNSNLVQGNTIGLNPAGSLMGNGSQGVALFQASSSDPSGPQFNVIGGSSIGASNIIAGSGYEGVALYDPGTIKNTISRNSIFSNQFAGIGMGSVYNNSNNNEVAPLLSSAVLGPAGNVAGTDIGGNFNGGAATIEFFASPAGNDEGQFFIGSAALAGSGNFSVSLAGAVPNNYVITATATDSNGNTSEFSAPQTVTTVDSDSDGIPDNWTMAHFNHTTGSAADKSRATDDADGDGLTNAQEFAAGTDPKNPASRFAITSIDQSTGAPRVGFLPVAGKTYQLRYRDDLLTGSWITLLDGIFAPSNSTIPIIDPSGTGLPKRFYRIELEP